MPEPYSLRPAGFHTGLGDRSSLTILNTWSGTTMTSGVLVPGACTTGMSISGATTTGISISGANTTGLLIAATTGKCISFAGSFSGAASASGILIGVGTATTPATTAVASTNFVELRCGTTATTGDNRLMYLQYLISGTGTFQGETLRSRTYLSGRVAVVRGAHISVDMTADGSASGLCVGSDMMLYALDKPPGGGTYYAAQSQIYCGASTDLSTHVHAIHKFDAGGHATGAATIRNLFSIGTVAVDAGEDLIHMFTTGCGQAALDTATTCALRIVVGTTTYWIPVATEIEAD